MRIPGKVAAMSPWGSIAENHSAQVAGSASRGRVVTLRSQDIAVFGGVQCIANSEAGSRHMLCSRRPRSRARYDVAIFPRSVIVYRMGNPDNPLYATP